MRAAIYAIVIIGVPAAAPAMPLSVFLPKAEALNKKGPMALFSSDLGVVKKEFATAGTELRDERRAVVKAGGKPAYCPPAKGHYNTDELLQHLRAIPVAQRGMSFKAAYKSFLATKWPCPA